MLVAGIFFGTMALFVKLGSQHFSALELVFYRSLTGLLFIAGMARYSGVSLGTCNIRMHLGRGIAGLSALGLYFYAMTRLPLATATTLNYTSPMFLTLITILWQREKVRPALVAAILLGFVGVILLLKPAVSASQLPIGLLGLMSGCLSAIAYLNIKQLAAAGEPDSRVVFYFSTISTLVAGILIPALDEFHAVSLRGAGLLLALGACATIAQLCMTRAYRTGRTLVVGGFAYSTIVFSALNGWLFLGEVLAWSSWLGMAIIIGAGLLAVRHSTPRND